MSRSPWPVATTVAALLLVTLGWYAFERGAQLDQSRLTPALLTGVFLALTTPAVAAMRRRPTDRWPRVVALAAGAFIVSYFRLLQPPLVAAVGAFVWYASLPVVLAAATGTARAPARRALASWLGATTVIAAISVVTSGPPPAPSRRAASWSYFDPFTQRLVQQTNPLGWWPTDRVAWIVWVAWSGVITAAAVWFLRPARWLWRVGVGVGVAASILLAIPQRPDTALHLDRWYGDLLTAVPAIVMAVAASWVVWHELVVPRLVRPAATVLRLDPATSGDLLRRRVSTTVGDRSAELRFRSGDRWISADGRPVPDDAGRGRQRWILMRDDAAIAAIDLDVASIDTPDLVEFTAAALGPSVDAQRLAARAAEHAATAQRAAGETLAAERTAQREMYELITEGPDATLAIISDRLHQRPLPIGEIHDGLRLTLEQVRSIARRTATTPIAGDQERSTIP